MKMDFKIIKPHEDSTLIDNLKEIYFSKDLMFILCKKDFSVKYKQAFLGITWAIFQPLLTSGIFSFIFNSLGANKGSSNSFFNPEIYVGVLLWQFFSKSVIDGSSSLVSSIGIISKVYFARAILPIISLLNALIDFSIGYLFFLVFFVFFNISNSEMISFSGAILLPLLIIPVALLALTIAYFLAPINALYRDVVIVLPFMLQLVMYTSPVIYPTDLMNKKLYILATYIPISNLILNARNSIRNGPDFNFSLGLIFFASLFTVSLALKFFKNKEQSIVDIV